jgi:hypothetical protein
VQNLVCQRHTKTGLSILRGRVLKNSRQKHTEHLIASADELIEILKSEFDLDVPEVGTLWPAIYARHAALFGKEVS